MNTHRRRLSSSRILTALVVLGLFGTAGSVLVSGQGVLADERVRGGPFPGEYAGTIVSDLGYCLPAAQVSIDGGVDLQCDGNGSFNIEVTPGPHNVRFTAWGHDSKFAQITITENETLDAGMVQLSVNISAMGLIGYINSNGQEMLVPNGWARSESYHDDNGKIDLYITGPILNDYTTWIKIVSGTDPTTGNDSVYLWSIINTTISNGQGDEYAPSLYEGPDFKVIDNHAAALVSIKYTNSSAVLRQVLIVDESHHFWILSFRVSDQAYAQYKPMFDEMALSFSAVNQSFVASDSGLWSFLVPVLIAITVIPITTALAIRYMRGRSKRKGEAATEPAPPTISPDEGDWFCPECGLLNREESLFCGYCGIRRH